MALTRAFLRGLKLDEEQVSAIIEAHTETVDGLKAVNNDTAKALEEAKEALKAAQDAGWEKKFNDLQAEYQTYKDNAAAKEARTVKETAYRQLLKDAGVSEKRIEGILKYDAGKVDKLVIDENGKVKDEANLTKGIKTDWADFITTTGTQGAQVSTPPATDSRASFDKMTLAEKMAFANEHPSEYAAMSAK